MKHRALDLLEKKDKKILGFNLTKLSELRLQWSKKQQQLQAKGLEDKLSAYLSVERHKHKVLNSLE